MQDRLSASQPISLRSPLTGRHLGSCEQPATSLSLVCFENLLAGESLVLGKEAKHRQVLRGEIAVQTDDDDDGEDDASLPVPL